MPIPVAELPMPSLPLPTVEIGSNTLMGSPSNSTTINPSQPHTTPANLNATDLLPESSNIRNVVQAFTKSDCSQNGDVIERLRGRSLADWEEMVRVRSLEVVQNTPSHHGGQGISAALVQYGPTNDGPRTNDNRRPWWSFYGWSAIQRLFSSSGRVHILQSSIVLGFEVLLYYCRLSGLQERNIVVEEMSQELFDMGIEVVEEPRRRSRGRGEGFWWLEDAKGRVPWLVMIRGGFRKRLWVMDRRVNDSEDVTCLVFWTSSPRFVDVICI